MSWFSPSQTWSVLKKLDKFAWLGNISFQVKSSDFWLAREAQWRVTTGMGPEPTSAASGTR